MLNETSDTQGTHGFTGTSYKAVVADVLGPICNYSLRVCTRRPLIPGELRIAVKAAGISFVDTLVAGGRYQGAPVLPFTPGSECAGLVEEVGEGISEWHIGQSVIVAGCAGTLAQSIVVPAALVWPMPTALSFAQAAILPVSYTTSWHALVDRGQLVSGDTLLVLGAGGATGFAAVQIGALLGCHVIASASSEAKRALAIAGGAHAVVESGAPNWREAVKAASLQRPIDVVFDPVGGAMTEMAFRCLGYGGRHVIVGFPAGITTMPTNLPLLKQASLVGANLGALRAAHPDRARANEMIVRSFAEDGKLRPKVSKSYPIEDFAKAMEAAASGQDAGRIVVEMA